MEGVKGQDWSAKKAEPNAARNLEVQGFHIFMPMERYKQRKGGRFVEALKPYFAGYFFAGTDVSSSPWRAIRSTHGVVQLVSFGGLIGRFEGLASYEGAWLLVDIMGQAARVKMRRYGVRRASRL